MSLGLNLMTALSVLEIFTGYSFFGSSSLIVKMPLYATSLRDLDLTQRNIGSLLMISILVKVYICSTRLFSAKLIVNCLMEILSFLNQSLIKHLTKFLGRKNSFYLLNECTNCENLHKMLSFRFCDGSFPKVDPVPQVSWDLWFIKRRALNQCVMRVASQIQLS